MQFVVGNLQEAAVSSKVEFEENLKNEKLNTFKNNKSY
jgi:hypothetical protein